MARGHIAKVDRAKPWVVMVDIGPDPATGKRRQRKRSYTTKREAERALAAWLAEIDRGEAIERSIITVEDLLRHWLDDHVAPSLRPRTLYLYSQTAERLIVPYLGTVPVQRLTPATVQSFYTRARQAGVSEWALMNAHKRLSQALTMALRQGIVQRNVCLLVTRPHHTSSERPTWDLAQARRFLAIAADSFHGPLWMMALSTGLRQGEVLALRWRDVHLDTRTLEVRQGSLRRTPAGVVAGMTKTLAGRRTVYLRPEVVTALRAYRAVQSRRRLERAAPYEDNDLVFATASGRAISPTNLRTAFSRLSEQAGIPHIRFYDARHTFATLAIDMGLPVKAVSESMGHADVSITLRTYTHVSRDQRARVADEVGDVLFGANEPDAGKNG